MMRKVLAGLILAPLLAAPAFAVAPTIGTFVGMDLGDISKNLAALGYDVMQIAADGDIIEAEVRTASEIYDIEVNPNTGLIEHVETDIDSDGDA